MTTKIVEGCTLEIDRDRGVMYVHGPKGDTLLRICSLPTPIPVPEVFGEGLDITHMYGASWAPGPTHACINCKWVGTDPLKDPVGGPDYCPECEADVRPIP